MKKQKLVYCKSCGRKFLLAREDDSRCAVCDRYICRKCMRFRLCPTHYNKMSMNSILMLAQLDKRTKTFSKALIVITMVNGLVIAIIVLTDAVADWYLIPLMIMGNMLFIPVQKAHNSKMMKKVKKIYSSQPAMNRSLTRQNTLFSLDKEVWNEVESMKTAFLKHSDQAKR